MPAEISRSLTVRAGITRVAVAAEEVAEVIRMPRITRVPHAPPCLLGVAHSRGIVLPVISLGALLGNAQGGDATRVVVLRRAPAIGLAVDAVETLQPLSAQQGRPERGRLMLGEGDDARAFDLDAALRERFSDYRRAQRSHDGATTGPPIAAARETKAFLAFSLADQAYALPLDGIAEVMDAPSALLALPHTDAVLSGVLDWRGQCVPAVSLRALLGLPEQPLAPSDRTIVVRIGAHHVALLVDHVSAILRVPAEAIGPAPSIFNSGTGEARIDALIRLPDGRGLVSILTPERILADARVGALLAAPSHRADLPMASPAPTAAARQRFLMMRLGDETYGIPIACVEEVVRFPDALTRLPRAPDYVHGVMNLRGKVIPVIDQRRRFALDGDEGQATRRIVIVTVSEVRAGFAVDAVSSILDVADADLMPSPELSGADDRLFDRAVPPGGAHEGDIILIIDPKVLLARAAADIAHDLVPGSAAP